MLPSPSKFLAIDALARADLGAVLSFSGGEAQRSLASLADAAVQGQVWTA